MTPVRTLAVLTAFAAGVALGGLAAADPVWFAGAAIAASVAGICWGLADAIAEPDEEAITAAPVYSPVVDLPAGMTYEQYIAAHRPPDRFVRLHLDAATGEFDIRPLWPHDIGAPE